jgi:hypothetical protein
MIGVLSGSVFSTKESEKVRAVLEYFHFMIGNSAEAWSCSSSRSDGDMLRMWFICSPFVLSAHDIKMTVPLEVCTKDKQHVIVHFLVCEGMKGQRSIDNWLRSMGCTVCHSEVYMSGSRCLKAAKSVLLVQAGKDPHPQTNITWSVLKQ